MTRTLCPLILAVLGLPMGAQSYRLNEPFVLNQYGSIFSYAPEPSGDRVFFPAAREYYSVRQLYSVPTDGRSPAVRWFLPGEVSGSVQRVTPCPGETDVVFQTGTGNSETLYSLALTEGARPVPLTPVGAGAPPRFDDRVLVTEHTRLVVYAPRTLENTFNLESVPLDGGAAPISLNDEPLSSFDNRPLFELSGCGDHVVYLGRKEGTAGPILCVPTDGSSPIREVNPGLRALWLTPFDETNGFLFTAFRSGEGTDLYSFRAGVDAPPVRLSRSSPSGYMGQVTVHPDGIHVLYVANHESNLTAEVYMVPLDGSSPPRKVSGDHPDMVAMDFVLTPDGERVVYRLRPRLSSSQTNKRLFSAPTDGSSEPLQLTDPFRTWNTRFAFEMSPDGRRVVFETLDPLSPPRYSTLHSVPVDGTGEPVALTGAVSTGFVEETLHFSPDGAFCIYRADHGSEDQFELLRTPVDGSGPPQRLNLAGHGGVSVEPEVSLTADRILYLADAIRDESVELLSVSFDGTDHARLSPEPPRRPHGDVREYRLAPRGKRVVYRANARRREVDELYSVRTDGRGAVLRVSSPRQPGDGVDSSLDSRRAFEISRAGDRVAYMGTEEGRYGLYSAPLDRPNSSLLLAPRPFQQPVFGLDLVAGHAFYSARLPSDPGVFDRYGLFEVPLLGGRASRLLTSTITEDGGVVSRDFLVHPEGDRVFFQARVPAGGPSDLFSVTTTEPPVVSKLSVPFGGIVRDNLLLTPSGRTVVYLNGRHLYAVPSDGSGEARRLTPETSFEGAMDFVLSSDGQLVLFRGEFRSSSGVELFAVPIGGSQPAFQLGGSPLPSARVDEFEADPTGSYAVFRGKLDGLGTAVYSAKLHEAAQQTKLSDPRAGWVRDFEVSPDGQRVAYRAGETFGPGHIELFIVDISGLTDPVRLNGDLLSGDVYDFAFTADGRSVLYVAAQRNRLEQELYIVPVDGSAEPRALNENPPLINGLTVASFALDPFAKRVLYVGNQREHGVLELFATPLFPPKQAFKPW